MAVRGEKPIKRIIEELRGIAKTRWLEKWSKWLNELLSNYDVEDPSVVLGFHDVYDTDKVQSFLVEHCSDLTENECFKLIERMVREKGYKRKLTEEVSQSILDYLKSVEKRPEVVYGFPWEVKSEIETLRARPELDGGKAYEIVYNFLTKEGLDPEEARKIAEEIKNTIPKVSPARRAELIETVMTITRITRQRTLDEYAKRERKAKEIVEKMSKALNERIVYAIIEDMNARHRYPTIDELKAELIKHDYDITGLEDIILSLKMSGAILEKDGRLYLAKYVAKPKAEIKPEVKPEVVPEVRPAGVAEAFIHPVKDFPPFIENLVKSGVVIAGRSEMCLDWVGAYEGWVIHVFSDTIVRYEPVMPNVFKVVLFRGHFIGIKGNTAFVYKCVR